ncbi:hypothetical protein F0562_000409 [Nyssa sinensis]|uniref:Pentatricopeptide repeat-containing protein n=1 Tax=Nyssa sinensis TaxID=561372 RepID=A0A5J5C024_9ASTE|nr:hypothetical protein F0562_000409 [Nyssa sinensis]
MVKVRVLLDAMPVIGLVSWKVIVSRYMDIGNLDGARIFYEAMPICDVHVGTWNDDFGTYILKMGSIVALGNCLNASRSRVSEQTKTFILGISLVCLQVVKQVGNWSNFKLSKKHFKVSAVTSIFNLGQFHSS